MNSDTHTQPLGSLRKTRRMYIYDLGKPQGHASLLQVEVSKTLNAQNSTCAEKKYWAMLLSLQSDIFMLQLCKC